MQRYLQDAGHSRVIFAANSVLILFILFPCQSDELVKCDSEVVGVSLCDLNADAVPLFVPVNTLS